MRAIRARRTTAAPFAWILARATDDDAVVAADWQPALFPHGLAYEYYAARSRSSAALPERLAVAEAFSLADGARLAGLERVFCCLRSVPNGCALLRALRAEFPSEEVVVFGRSVYVHVFTRT
jgi:hypothetical protein